MRAGQEVHQLVEAPAAQPSVRVMAADDSPVWTAGLAALLRHSRFTVEVEARTSHEALVRAQEPDVDLVIMDISMPEQGREAKDAGLRTTRALRAAGVPTPVLLLSDHFDTDHAVDFFREGHRAVGYLPKLAVRHRSVLLDALERLHSGGLFVDSAVIEVLMRREKAHQRLSILTARQVEVLQLMAQGQTNAGIAGQLGITKKAVEGHVLELNRRLAPEVGLDQHPEALERRVAAILWYLSGRLE